MVLIFMSREKNKKFWEENKEEIHNDYKGKWIVIADEQIIDTGNSFEEVKDSGLNKYNHRYLIKVREESNSIHSYHPPMSKKKD